VTTTAVETAAETATATALKDTIFKKF
jgi:hypothetical protein